MKCGSKLNDVFFVARTSELTGRSTSGDFPAMVALTEIEAAILELPLTEKARLVDWLDEHRDEIAPVTDGQRTEWCRRQSE